MNKRGNSSLLRTPPLSGFEHVNRYWDKDRQVVVAKILPGEFYVTASNESIATTLGSCVSACIWDKVVGVGGMNHFMLPLTEDKVENVNWGSREKSSDATRFGNYAMEHLINEVLKNGGRRKNLLAKVFGGGKVMRSSNNIGEKNSLFVLDYLDVENIPIVSKDLGDLCPRKVIFNPVDGKVLIKKLKTLHNETIYMREKSYRDTIVNKDVGGDVELF